jgi:hypothetical protein
MWKAKELPSKDVLHSLFEYKDGNIYHKTSHSGVCAGQLAGSHKPTYAVVKISNNPYKLHRVIFMMHHGYCAENIDHINGNKHDNRIENLRSATQAENKRNKALDARNKSGIKGVYWHYKAKKWIAKIRLNGKNKHLGTFSDLSLAQEFMELAREMVHGKFANHGQFTA